MFKTTEGSTGRLLQLCAGYFFFYVITGVLVKYFTSGGLNLPHVGQVEYLVYNTIGGSAICLAVVFLFRWYRLKTNNLISVAGIKFPAEFLYIIPSGVCTAVVIPTTTLMYLLPISVMVAMVIMRGSVIIISRLVDAIQIKQGILKKRVYWEEEAAVVFAILAVSTDIIFAQKADGFDFIHSTAAMAILLSYIGAYSIRIYIMNYYKNTRGKGVPQDNKGFFAIEQFAASITMLLIAYFVFKMSPSYDFIAQYQSAIHNPTIHWSAELTAGFAYGAVAFFSVFLFMFKGRTATFAGLVNRLTSLIAGTAATIIFWFFFSGKFPTIQDWASLACILVAVAFLTKAEKRRIRELKAAHEIK